MDASSRELNAEQWERLKAVVADALEKDDLAEGRAFVARACQDDPAVLREAEAMLAFSPQRLERQSETIATVLPVSSNSICFIRTSPMRKCGVTSCAFSNS